MTIETVTHSSSEVSSQQDCNALNACDVDLCGRGQKDVDDSIAPLDSRYGTSADETVNEIKVGTVPTEEPDLENPVETDTIEAEKLTEDKTNVVHTVETLSEDVRLDESSAAKDTATEEGNSQAQDTYYEEEEKEKATDRGRNVFMVLIGFLLVVGVIVAAVILIPSGNAKKDSVKSASTQNNMEPTGSPVEPTGSPVEPTASPVEPTTTVDGLIRQVAIFGGAEFDNEESYQSKALNWIKKDSLKENRALLENSRWGSDRIVQRYALACFYFSTYAVEHEYTEDEVKPWKNETKWLDQLSECDWYGVQCADSSVVTAIEMGDNNLSGSLPREITLFKSLKHLDLHKNALFNFGSEGNDWLGEMSSMETLNVAHNFFDYDGLPISFSKLTNLVELDCSYTLYFGNLKEETFIGLDQLEYLDISGNQYNGTLPESIVTLPALEYLYAEQASLTGTLDFMKKDAAALVEFWAGNNDFEGNIPSSIGEVESLISLDLHSNKLSGTIPSEVGKLTGMVQIWLYNNQLTGTIPSEIIALSGLKIFNSKNNNLEGVVPEGLCSSSNIINEQFVADCSGKVTCSCCSESACEI